jgi:hypothetical protein
MRDIGEDLAVVQAIGEQLQLPMLETLIYIDDNRDEFSQFELGCFHRVFNDFRKLFAPKVDTLVA